MAAPDAGDLPGAANILGPAHARGPGAEALCAGVPRSRGIVRRARSEHRVAECAARFPLPDRGLFAGCGEVRLAEVWAAQAQLHQYYILRGWDTSDARRELARSTTQRAIRLDPNSFEARFAQANLFDATGREGVEKEKLLRELRGERPSDQRVLRALGTTIELQGRVDESAVLFDESAALPGGDPLALYDKSMAFWFVGRTTEAEMAIRASLAQRGSTAMDLSAAGALPG